MSHSHGSVGSASREPIQPNPCDPRPVNEIRVQRSARLDDNRALSLVSALVARDDAVGSWRERPHERGFGGRRSDHTTVDLPLDGARTRRDGAKGQCLELATQGWVDQVQGGCGRVDDLDRHRFQGFGVYNTLSQSS